VRVVPQIFSSRKALLKKKERKREKGPSDKQNTNDWVQNRPGSKIKRGPSNGRRGKNATSSKEKE